MPNDNGRHGAGSPCAPAPPGGPWDERQRAIQNAIFEGASHLIIATDEGGTIIDINPAAERLLGYRARELVGRATPLALHDPDEIVAEAERLSAELGVPVAPGFEVFVARARRGLPSEREWTYIRKDGGRFPVLLAVSPLRGADGRLIGFVGISTDLTERRAHERALVGARAEARARRAAEGESLAKSRFLAAASHDLRQPLQSAILFASALLPHVSVGRGLEVLGRLENSLESLRTLLDSLLDISKLDGGAVRPRLAPFPLGRLLGEMDEAYAPRAAGRGLSLSVEPSGVVVLSDAELLGRILRNLIENALRYTPQGSVRVRTTVADGHVVVAVCDTGVGIPADSLDAIFEEFHRVGDDRAGERGLGLGLAIVRRLSVLLGHAVRVESRLGEGSTFTVHVPLAPGPAADDGLADRTAPDGGQPDAHGRLVLVIEDDPQVRAALVAMIRQWGYDTLDAGSPAEAEAMARAIAPRRPDILVADYRLGDGAATGTEAIRAVHAACGGWVPAVVVTGDTAPDCIADVERNGFHLLHKPVTAARLRAVLAATG